MSTEDDNMDPIEHKVRDITQRLQPRDVDAAKRRLLGEYDRLQHHKRQSHWRVPAAMAAGVLLGVLGVHLYQQQLARDPFTQPLSNRTPASQHDGIPRLLHQQDKDRASVDIKELLATLETASAETWMETIAGRLEKHDWQTARALLIEFEKRFDSNAPED
jgi:hypothetical protein